MRKSAVFTGFLATVMALLLAACGGNNSNNNGYNNGTNNAPSLSVSPESATITVGQSEAFTVNAVNTGFTVSAEAGAGCTKTGDVTVTCSPSAPGSYTLTVTATADSSLKKTVPITAEAPPAPQIEVTENAEQEVWADEVAGKEVKFKAAEDWTATVSADAASWLTLDKTSGLAGENALEVMLERNTTGEERTATITISPASAAQAQTLSAKATKAVASKSAASTQAVTVTIIVTITITQKPTRDDGVVPIPDVYAAGFEDSVIKVWKNGAVLHELTDGIYTAIANSMYVSGKDVYVAGYECVTENSFGPAVAKVWKNGSVLYELTDGEKFAYANSVYVSGRDVYTAGGEARDGIDIAKVWKNGSILYELTDGTKNAVVRSIFVSGNDVYATGRDGSIAKVWKNGAVLYTLTDGTYDALGSSIYVSGGDVYVSGTEDTGIRESFLAPVPGSIVKVWKNGTVLYELTDGTKQSNGNSVYVSDGEVYVSTNEMVVVGEMMGFGASVAKVWKNGIVLYELTNGTNASIVYELYVSGKDVYAAGWEKPSAKVWKDGAVLYGFADSGDSSVTSLFVR